MLTPMELTDLARGARKLAAEARKDGEAHKHTTYGHQFREAAKRYEALALKCEQLAEQAIARAVRT